jgi:hypothetical protein
MRHRVNDPPSPPLISREDWEKKFLSKKASFSQPLLLAMRFAENKNLWKQLQIKPDGDF